MSPTLKPNSKSLFLLTLSGLLSSLYLTLSLKTHEVDASDHTKSYVLLTSSPQPSHSSPGVISSGLPWPHLSGSSKSNSVVEKSKSLPRVDSSALRASTAIPVVGSHPQDIPGAVSDTSKIVAPGKNTGTQSASVVNTVKPHISVTVDINGGGLASELSIAAISSKPLSTMISEKTERASPGAISSLSTASATSRSATPLVTLSYIIATADNTGSGSKVMVGWSFMPLILIFGLLA